MLTIQNITPFILHCRGIETIGDTACHCLHVELATGKYVAHPDVKTEDYITNMPLTEPLTLSDRGRVSKDYTERICKHLNFAR